MVDVNLTSKKGNKRKLEEVETPEEADNEVTKVKAKKMKKSKSKSQSPDEKVTSISTEESKGKKKNLNEEKKAEKKVEKKEEKKEKEERKEKKEEKKEKKEEKKEKSNSDNNDADQAAPSNEPKNESGEPAKNKISKRKLKKEKKLAREEAIRMESHKIAVERAMNYLSKWKHARSEWKFEKIRQTWLINNLFDENCVSEEMFATLLEYLEGCKGLARDQLLKKGQSIIQKVEQDADNEEATESVEYKRARLLLQSITS